MGVFRNEDTLDLAVYPLPALGRQRQEDPEFQASLCCIGRPCQGREEKGKIQEKGFGCSGWMSIGLDKRV
jgi:hypothetical protein